MDRVINLNKMDFHYWINELPELEVKNACEKVIEVKNTNRALNDTLKVALELSLQRHISSYAMLGFEYNPVKNSDTLTARISYYDEDNDINYLSNIRSAMSCKYIHTGIDKFLLQAVIDKIIDISEEKRLPAGDLNFKVASNCEVSSSPWLFGIITKVLLNILVTINKKRLLENSYSDKLFTEALLNSEIMKIRGTTWKN